MRSRRGSYTVYIVMFFGSMMILTFAVITAAGNIAISAVTDHFGRLWGTSILAEYDRNLKDRYGIFGFYGETSLIEKKLDVYAVYTFSEKKYIEYGRSSCSLDSYRLSDPELIKIQMMEAVLCGSRPHGLLRGADTGNTNSGKAGSAQSENGFGYRKITSRWITENLPSAADRGNWDFTGLVSRIEKGEGLSQLLGTSAVNQYIFSYFRHNQSTEKLGDTYFKNEIEYILSGKADDEGARKQVRRSLVTMRNMLNLAYLYSSPEKREAAMTLASVMTPGPEAVLTQGVLMELWAFAEAENDMRILEAGLPVPLLKRDLNWALTLENAVNASSSNSENDTGPSDIDFLAPPEMDGEEYESYLRVLLTAVPENTRILRAMDLIQINMKYLYCDYFLLKDYCTGLDFSLQVNGVKHEFSESYDRSQEETGQLSG